MLYFNFVACILEGTIWKKLFFDDGSRYVMNYALMEFRYHNLQFINDDDDDDVSVVIFKWAIRSNK